MTNVTSLDDHRPHITGQARCSKCKHEWAAVVPESADQGTLTCPECKSYFGAFLGPMLPEVRFVCKCGGDLFYLSPEGHVCHACNTISFSWNEALEE